VIRQLDRERRPDRLPGLVPSPTLLGLLVPHAGLMYSGLVAAAAWQLLEPRSEDSASPEPLSVVILGTNHRAGWLHGLGAWDRGAWQTPLGETRVDTELAAAIVALGPPVLVDHAAHAAEHSIEVQLPFLQVVAPAARIVPLAVATGTGAGALEIGTRLGAALASRRREGRPVVLAISSDMAHYPAARDAAAVTAELLPAIRDLDGSALAAREAALRARGVPGLTCGMCGIEPAVVGLAALAAAGAVRTEALAAATSADAGGPRDATVGYLSAAFFD
jgi:AmmeMemoRadiSam system protein B